MTQSPLHAADWPTYRNSNARTGATADALPTDLTLAWEYTAPSVPKAAWAGPENRLFEGKQMRHRVLFDDALHTTAANGKVYFGSSIDHQLYCLNASTGEIEWTFYTGGPIRLAPTIWEQKMYVGSDDGFVYCLDAAGGELIWKRQAGPVDEWFLGRGEMISRWPIRTDVLVDDGVAYFGAGIFPHEDIYLYALDATDGSIVWERDDISEAEAGRNDLSPQGYLLATDELLFVPSGRSLPVAIDRKTGEWVHKRSHGWRGDGGGIVGGTRAMLAHGQLFTAGPHHMLAMDQKTGDVGFGWFTGREVVIDGDWAYLANDKRIAKVDLKEYAVASRERQKLREQLSDLYRDIRSADDEAARAELQKEYDQLQQKSADTENAGVAWQQQGDMESSMLVAENVVISGGNGRLAMYDDETGEKLWNVEVEGDARGLAAADGRLLVSTSSGKVYCFAAADSVDAANAVTAQSDDSPFPNDELSDKYAQAAKEILQRSGIDEGFCLVVGSEQGRLAYELARQSKLKIFGIEPDEHKAAAAREALSSAGVYGHRVVIHHRDPGQIPYSNYFANLIVSDSLLSTGRLPGDAATIARRLKPMGGVICLRPSFDGDEGHELEQIAAWLRETDIESAGEVSVADGYATVTRGELPGAGSWSHLYGDAGNTASSEDQRVKGGLGVLWFGEPGIGKMVNRHDGAVGPLAVGGRLFVQGQDTIGAYDAYNGRFLWERDNNEALRTGVFKNFNPGNLVASEDSLFAMIKERCVEFDAATGETKHVYELPPLENRKAYQWGYVAYYDGILFGTATVREEIEERRRRRGRATIDSTDAIFAFDTNSGEHLWTYTGGSISHHTIAMGPERVFFIDSSITGEERAALLREDKSDLQQLEGDEAKAAEEKLKDIDVRLAVSLDARTGEKTWSIPVDVTDCSEIGTGGGQLTLMYQNNVLVLCGANANGHYWRQFLSGEFKQRRLVCLSAEDGHRLWAKDANYRHRPIVVEDKLIAEPWSFDLYTGAQQMRENPLTGEPEPWSMVRPGHHCGMLTGCPNMLMFRSGFTGFYNLENDEGTRHFAGHRLGCWINAIPANGLVMIPEASAGCVCLFSIASTVTLEPREARRPWTIVSSVGAKTPVRHMHINFAAPGDRRDARGTTWLAYPRPRPGKETGLDLKLDFEEHMLAEGELDSRSERSTSISNAETQWIYTSAAEGMVECAIPLLGEKNDPATYTVKLHFAELDDEVKAGTRLFDVKLQGQTVLENFDVAAEAGGVKTAVVREIPGVEVTDHLKLEMTPKAENPTPHQVPSISAIEVMREE